MVFRKVFLFVIALFFMLVTAAQATTPEDRAAAMKVPPPVMLECRSKSNCDLDREHIKTFIVGFYMWYGRTSFDHMIPWDEKPVSTVLRKVLTRSLYGKLNKIVEDGADPITRVQDFYDYGAWVPELQINFLEVNTDRLSLKLIFNPDYQLTVNLKPINGQWRIDEILDKYDAKR